MDLSERLLPLLPAVADFPRPGVGFRDITPLLAAPLEFGLVIEALAVRAAPLRLQALMAMEARGFFFGAPLALRLGIPLVPVRKAGKLPRATRGVTYALEYGQDRLEMHEDAVLAGQRVGIVDDVLATGGTAAATVHLAQEAGAQAVAGLFLIELATLGGRSRLSGLEIHSLLQL